MKDKIHSLNWIFDSVWWLIENFLLRKGTESSHCNTFSVGCRGFFRSDSVGWLVGWKVSPKSVGGCPSSRIITIQLYIFTNLLNNHFYILIIQHRRNIKILNKNINYNSKSENGHHWHEGTSEAGQWTDTHLTDPSTDRPTNGIRPKNTTASIERSAGGSVRRALVRLSAPSTSWPYI